MLHGGFVGTNHWRDGRHKTRRQGKKRNKNAPEQKIALNATGSNNLHDLTSPQAVFEGRKSRRWPALKSTGAVLPFLPSGCLLDADVDD
jgi:hypothetical protein